MLSFALFNSVKGENAVFVSMANGWICDSHSESINYFQMY